MKDFIIYTVLIILVCFLCLYLIDCFNLLEIKYQKEGVKKQ